jgi:hypothetical protein
LPPPRANDGQITFAQASWIPDLSARLLGALRLSAASRELITGPDRPDCDIGTVLVQRNYLSRRDLQAILRSVVVDAALARPVLVNTGRARSRACASTSCSPR